jgi:hypothetical protein
MWGYHESMGVPEKFRLDRTAVSVVGLTERQNDRAYWLSRTPAERFEALELLRQIAYGYDPATERLQRIFEIAQLEPG